MFGHFTTLFMKGLNLTLDYLLAIKRFDEALFL